jgi:hypothetical protein
MIMRLLLGLALAGIALSAPARAQVGNNAPEFDGKKWYNTAPLALEDLKGKAVHIVVFRTW